MGADIALRRRAGYIHGLRTIRRSPRVFAILQAAGWPIWPLLFASIVAVALIIERLITLRRSKILPEGLLEKVVGELRQGGATPEITLFPYTTLFRSRKSVV